MLVHSDSPGLHTEVAGKNIMTFARISPDGQSVAYVENAFHAKAEVG